MNAVIKSDLIPAKSLVPSSKQTTHGRQGRAEFAFDYGYGDRTYLARQYVEYPFHITRPHYLENSWPGFATLCLQSVSGGLFQGDRVSLKISMAPDSAAQVTTQASTKVHTMEHDHARQTVEITLEPTSYLEYFSDPMILFPHSHLHTTLTIRLAESAKGIIRESFFHYDPTGAIEPLFDHYLSEVTIVDLSGNPLVIDRQQIDMPNKQKEMCDVLQEFPYQGSVYILGSLKKDNIQRTLNDVVNHFANGYGGITSLPNQCGYFLRLLAKDGITLRQMHDSVAKHARGVLVGYEVGTSWRK